MNNFIYIPVTFFLLCLVLLLFSLIYFYIVLPFIAQKKHRRQQRLNQSRYSDVDNFYDLQEYSISKEKLKAVLMREWLKSGCCFNSKNRNKSMKKWNDDNETNGTLSNRVEDIYAITSLSGNDDHQLYEKRMNNFTNRSSTPIELEQQHKLDNETLSLSKAMKKKKKKNETKKQTIIYEPNRTTINHQEKSTDKQRRRKEEKEEYKKQRINVKTQTKYERRRKDDDEEENEVNKRRQSMFIHSPANLPKRQKATILPYRSLQDLTMNLSLNETKGDGKKEQIYQLIPIHPIHLKDYFTVSNRHYISSSYLSPPLPPRSTHHLPEQQSLFRNQIKSTYPVYTMSNGHHKSSYDMNEAKSLQYHKKDHPKVFYPYNIIDNYNYTQTASSTTLHRPQYYQSDLFYPTHNVVNHSYPPTDICHCSPTRRDGDRMSHSMYSSNSSTTSPTTGSFQSFDRTMKKKHRYRRGEYITEYIIEDRDDANEKMLERGNKNDFPPFSQPISGSRLDNLLTSTHKKHGNKSSPFKIQEDNTVESDDENDEEGDKSMKNGHTNTIGDDNFYFSRSNEVDGTQVFENIRKIKNEHRKNKEELKQFLERTIINEETVSSADGASIINSQKADNNELATVL
ncbi:hypothetical protein SNEBB_001758 [Seison nebaliae]|nr:hypothetical protein SNEBB_001758 [Seison nebaliae]